LPAGGINAGESTLHFAPRIKTNPRILRWYSRDQTWPFLFFLNNCVRLQQAHIWHDISICHAGQVEYDIKILKNMLNLETIPRHLNSITDYLMSRTAKLLAEEAIYKRQQPITGTQASEGLGRRSTQFSIRYICITSGTAAYSAQNSSFNSQLG
jgi:hypothetical protein